MFSLKRIVGILVLLAVFSSLIVACQPSEVETPEAAEPVQAEEVVEPTEAVAPEPQEEPTEAPMAAEGPKGTLRVALSTFPNSLFIPLTAERNADNAATQLFDSLIYIDTAGEIQPALAESWDISDDGTVYTFHLREGVTFHNGEAFTADDVIATWESGSENGEWTDKYTLVTVDKVDDYTVTLTTEAPNPELFDTIFDFWDIIPNEYYAEVGLDGFQEHPIGTGPFMFVEWVKGDHIT